jgi:hypothetical protein
VQIVNLDSNRVEGTDYCLAAAPMMFLINSFQHHNANTEVDMAITEPITPPPRCVFLVICVGGVLMMLGVSWDGQQEQTLSI